MISLLLSRTLRWREEQPALGGPGADDPARVCAFVQGAAQGLAVQRHHFAAEHRAHALRPARQTSAELFWIQSLEDAVVGVVGGRAVAQAQEGFQPVEPDLAEVLHVGEALAAAEDRAQGDGEEVGQIVIHRGRDARIGHLLQAGEQAGEWGFGDVSGVEMRLHPVSSRHTVQKYKDKMAHRLRFPVCVSPGRSSLWPCANSTARWRAKSTAGNTTA